MDYTATYVNFLKKFLKPRRKLKVVFDCSNGTTGKVLKELFRKPKAKRVKLKVSTVFINDKPDGNFPGHGPNPMAPGAIRPLQKTVLKHKANLGVIFDADGDRVFFVDDKGRFIHPDETGYLLLQELKPKKYAIGPIAGELLKNSKYQILDSRFFVSKVGHYFFKKLMREKNIPLGLEHSGHYYFFVKGGSAAGGGNAYFDSGILAAIHIINFLSRLNIKLSTYLDKLSKYYRSGEINFKISGHRMSKNYRNIGTSDVQKLKILNKVEQKYKNKGAKISKLDGLTIEMSGPSTGSGRNSQEFRLNLRPSNTENLLRLNLEAKNKKLLNQELKRIKRLIKKA